MFHQVADTTHGDAWNEYRPDNIQTWDDIPSIVFLLDGVSTHAFIVWDKSWRPDPI